MWSIASNHMARVYGVNPFSLFNQVYVGSSNAWVTIDLPTVDRKIEWAASLYITIFMDMYAAVYINMRVYDRNDILRRSFHFKKV